MKQETIEILPCQPKVKEMLIDDAVAKRSIAARLKYMPGHEYGNPERMSREQLMGLMSKIFYVTVEKHEVSDGFELILVKGEKGVDLKNIIVG